MKTCHLWSRTSAHEMEISTFGLANLALKERCLKWETNRVRQEAQRPIQQRLRFPKRDEKRGFLSECFNHIKMD